MGYRRTSKVAWVTITQHLVPYFYNFYSVLLTSSHMLMLCSFLTLEITVSPEREAFKGKPYDFRMN